MPAAEPPLDPPQKAQLGAYAELLRAWASRLNLVAGSDLERLHERHLYDSLRLLPLLELTRGVCVDVGSGAGLPGIPLAIAAPDRPWVLIEPRKKRAAFLEEAVRSLGLRCTIRAETAEQAAQELGGAGGLVVSRALATPERAVELSRPLVAPSGLIAVFHGPEAVLPADAEEWTEGIAIVRGEAHPPRE